MGMRALRGLEIGSKALIIGLVGGLLLVGIAYAHAAYVRSTPGADAVIATPPARVDIWFEQELFRRKGENTISVTAPDGQQVSVGDTVIDDDDRKHVWVNLKPDLAAGVYQVAWKNVSLEDGHPTEGSFSFTIDPQAATSTPMSEPIPIGPTAAQPTIAAPSVATPTKASPPISVCGVPVAAIVGAAAYVTLARSRRKRF
jgi:hypothetical protein